MVQLFTNFAESTLQQSIEAGDVIAVIDSTEADNFPSPGGGDYAVATIFDHRNASSEPEIVHITSRTGGTLTIQRAQESTAAQLWPAGSRLYLSLTAGAIQGLLNLAEDDNSWTGTATGTNAYTLTIVGDLPTPNDGDEVTFIIPNTNTTACTLVVSNGVDPSVGPFDIRAIDGQAFGAGEFAAGFYATLRWVAASNYWQSTSATSTRLAAAAVNQGPLAPANIAFNGDIDTWNGGTTFNTPASGAVTADGITPTYDGAIGTFSISRQAFTPGHVDVAGDPQWFLRWDQTVAGSGSTFRRILFILRARNGVAWRNGERATLAFYMKADSARTVTSRILQNFGTGGAPSAEVVADSQGHSITSSWQRFTRSFDMPSITGKTLGTNDDHYIGISFDLPINTTMTIDLAMVQLEPGPRASEPFGMYPIPLRLGGLGAGFESYAALATFFGPFILTDLLTRDGAGSLLDADKFDSLESTDFMRTTGSVAQTATGIKTFSSTALFQSATPARFEGAAGTNRQIFFQTGLGAGGAGQRWSLGVDNVAESGSNAGTNFNIAAYDDTGAFTGFFFTGERSTRFMTITAGLLIPDGVVGTPGLRFSGDLDTGIYRVGANTFGISAGGAVSTQFGVNGVQTVDGAVGTPSYSWISDPDTGLYKPAASNAFDIACGGVLLWRFSNPTFFTNSTVAGAGIRVSDGTAGAPTYAFTNETDCGFYFTGVANTVGASTGGTLRFSWNTTALTFESGYDVVINTATAPSATGSVGWRGCPTETQNSAYNFVLADAGKAILHDETSARTWTIPANASVAFPIGTTIIIDNTGNAGGAPGALTIAITSDTLRRGDGTAGTGSRTVPSNGVAVIRKTKATEWDITGIFT